MYKLINNRFGNPDCVQRLSDSAFIPLNPANTDYQEYLKWLAEGNFPFAADALMPKENGDTFTLSA
jgi:hypothetical protein